MQRKHKLKLSIWNILIAFIVITIATLKIINKPSFELQNGDLLFQDLDSSPLCDAIEKVTSSVDGFNFSHIGVLVMINNEKFVLEAFTNGVELTPIKIFLDRSLNLSEKPKVIAGRLKKQYSHLINDALDHGLSLIGKKYDDEFKINNNKFYCSELIYEIFLYSNKSEFFPLSPMTYQYNGETLEIWIDYFNKLNIPIPENQPGINPGGISLSKKIDIIYNYMN